MKTNYGNASKSSALTKDSIKISDHLFNFQPYSYVEQLQTAYQSGASFINMTTAREENAFLDLNKKISQIGVEFFKNNLEYDYKMTDPYYRKTLYTSLCHYYNIQSISAEQVFFGAGTYDLWKTLAGFVLPKGTAIGLGPQFPDYVGLIKATGRGYLDIHNTVFNFPAREIISTINQLRENCCCVIIDRPSNPNGLCGSLDEIESILTAAAKYGVPVVIDEAYGNYFQLDESAISLVPKYKNIVWMRPNSKAYGIGGLRVGALIFGSEVFASYFQKVHTPVAPDIFSVQVSKVLFEDGDSLLIPLQNKIREMKKKLTDQLLSYGYFCLPSHANVPVLMFRKENINLAKAFLEQQIIVRSGEYYKGTCPNMDASFARIRVPLNDGKLDSFLHAAKSIAASK